ncbi:MAG: exodeoxyribonuclease VII large subunit [Candidatus Hydrothermarchaeales archaeon]
MDDSTLLKISILVSTIGLITLFFVSSYTRPPNVKISEITYDDVGVYTVIKGKITSKNVHKDGHIFFDIADDTGKMKVVLFSGTAETLNSETLACLEVGKNIEVKGKVDEYKGSLEIIPKVGEDVSCSSP